MTTPAWPKLKISGLKYILVLGLMVISHLSAAAVTTQNLRCEYLNDPQGIDVTTPRLGWIINSDRRGEMQTAYQVMVASSLQLLDQDKGDLWDSGKVPSDESSQIAYAGQPLVSREGCFWKVRTWDRDDKTGEWSPVAQWSMGLLQPADWSAKWIAPMPANDDTNAILSIHHATYETVAKGPAIDVTDVLNRQIKEGRLKMVINNQTLGVDPATNVVKRLRVEFEYRGQIISKEVAENQTLMLPVQSSVVPCLRKSFELKSAVQRAVLHVTALGLYEVRINGQRVGDHVLAPDWTDYRKRVRYQTFDVTGTLKPGENVVGALLADGWFSGHIGNGGYEFYGKEPAFLAQLEVTYADGHAETIVTDRTWKSHASPISSADFMLGENYDARLEIKGWDRPGLDEGNWSAVEERDESFRKLESQVMPPVRELCELTPKTIKEIRPGTWVYDLDQNMVGVVRLKVSAPAGTKITLRHAEMLNPDGSLYTTNLRGAPSIDHYVCNGDGVEVWQPRFTFHGFRYVEITGLNGQPQIGAITGIVIGSDTPRTGEFTCSDPRINQLQSNIQWGQRGNYISVPTDCPQRDERLGWMGDAEVFIRTATYNADVASFFTKWLVDVDDAQSPAGAFSNVSPNPSKDIGGVAAWADAGVICPWTIYEMYGDRRILESHLPAMIKWVDYLQSHSDGLIRDKNRGEDFGDWLSINADTPKDLIGTAFFAYSAGLLAKSCRVLGRVADADKYDRLVADIKTAFNKRYVAADGRIQGNTQCAYAMALKFGLLPEELRPKAAQYLEADIKAKGNHLSTGFVGVSYLLPVLTQAGKADAAYGLLQQDTFPSWLFSVKHGATTIWERWDGWTPEKGFQDPGMNSFNHYSLGSCGEYLFGYIGGIRPDSPGFKTILIDPVIRDGLTWAKTSFDSAHGTVATAWKTEGKRLTLEISVPANTTATVRIPTSDPASITESGRPVEQVEGVKFLRQENGRAIFRVGSGTYKFASDIFRRK
ncbi:MAG TPA: family 78 glycoside hydrolase catalytic domain [Candidatus Acidoferrales bacterium]|jgi:alpha-L-rhamnosidase|nr:family 78 glycoside hydrolase catalytic domain [Candidatus Acidoferrales bacterium]